MSAEADFNTCVENIDIGGPSMLRSGAKNYNRVAVLTSPVQYDDFKQQLNSSSKWVGGQLNVSSTYDQRKTYAAAAFQLSASYDTAIARYFAQQLAGSQGKAEEQAGKQEMEVWTEAFAAEPEHGIITRTYKPELVLKYGCNPHQKPAYVYSIISAPSGKADTTLSSATSSTAGNNLPFKVLSGTPGYINLLDATYAWQLVRELKQTLGVAAAASFKHCSPAGAAMGSVPLSAAECAAYEIDNPDSLTAPVRTTCCALNFVCRAFSIAIPLACKHTASSILHSRIIL